MSMLTGQLPATLQDLSGNSKLFKVLELSLLVARNSDFGIEKSCGHLAGCDIGHGKLSIDAISKSSTEQTCEQLSSFGLVSWQCLHSQVFFSPPMTWFTNFSRPNSNKHNRTGITSSLMFVRRFRFWIKNKKKYKKKKNMYSDWQQIYNVWS